MKLSGSWPKTVVFAIALSAAPGLCSLTPQVALAAKKTSSKDDKRARDLYKKGDRAYAEGRYEEALPLFEEAYELSERPLLLYNLSNTYERLGRYQEAFDALTKYRPNAEKGELDVIDKRLENLKRRADEKQKAEEAAEKARQQAAEPPKPKPVAPKPKPKPKPQPVVKEQPAPVLGYVLVGAGGAAIATGAVFGVMALGARSDADANCKDSASGKLCSAAAQDDLDHDKTYSLVADVGIGVGVVAAAIGVYLIISNGSSESAPQTAVGAAPRQGGGEFRLVTSF